MMRNPSLRQLEALMAVVETGTVSRAADVLHISQPAASKLIKDLEADTALELFDRENGRLMPTSRGMRLYEEVQRVFGGVNQLARAVETIRREERGRIVLGALPALSGRLISRALAAFLERYPAVSVSVETFSSQFLVEAVLLRRIDVALVTGGHEHPSIHVEPLPVPAMVAVLPRGHPLAKKSVINVEDLAGEAFIAMAPASLTRTTVDAAFTAKDIMPRIVIEATTAPAVGELVAHGLGVTVADPLAMEAVADRVVTRPFQPELSYSYNIIRPPVARNRELVSEFIVDLQKAAQAASLSY